MKQQQMLVVLAVLIGAILLGIWMRRGRREGFADAPECTYSTEIPNKYILNCVNNLETPFVCIPYSSFDAAKAACNANENCRGIVKRPGQGGPDMYTIRSGGFGGTDYNDLNKMKSEMLGDSATESVYLITNLNQCKPNTTASTTTTADKVFTANLGPRGTGPVGGGMAVGPAGPGPIAVGGPSITVPADTLLAVPAGQTIFARRTATTGGQGVAESQPAGIVANLQRVVNPPAPGSFQATLTKQEFDNLNIPAEERLALAAFPEALQLKIADASRKNIPLRDALTPDELNLVRTARATTAPPPPAA